MIEGPDFINCVIWAAVIGAVAYAVFWPWLQPEPAETEQRLWLMVIAVGVTMLLLGGLGGCGGGGSDDGSVTTTTYTTEPAGQKTIDPPDCAAQPRPASCS